jgi:ABC-2 type transport system ATP-binding protein
VLLTTQYLEEAEQLSDRIAILHEGRIIANGTLAELKKLLPPAKVEYVEKQPTLCGHSSVRSQPSCSRLSAWRSH